LKFRPHVNVVLDIISVPYTFTELQAHKTLVYIPRGAEWNDGKTCFSAPQNAK